MFWTYYLTWFIGFMMGGVVVLEMYFNFAKKELIKKNKERK